MIKKTEKVIHIATPSIGEDEWLATKEVFMSGWVTQGPKVKNFEEKFAHYHDCSFGIAVTSCTTGLHLALTSIGIGPGDKVIVPAFTWVATANAVRYCGAEPVFADVDPLTFNLDLKKLSNFNSKDYKAIIPVHLFGLCVNMDELKRILPNIAIIEDAACAVGSTYKGQKAGSLGDIGVFSLHPRKVISTGEGGVLTTNSSKLNEKSQSLRNHGASISEEMRHIGNMPYLLPEFKHIGFNYRMTDIQGAVGLIQLQKLDSLLIERRKWANYYISELQKIPWLHLPPAINKDYGHTYQSFVMLFDKQMPFSQIQLLDFFQRHNVHTRAGTHSVVSLEVYRDPAFREKFPGTTLSAEYSIGIPLHPGMSADDYEYVVSIFHEINKDPYIVRQ